MSQIATPQVTLGSNSSIWSQLALPNSPAGAVPFVYTDQVTIAIDPINYNYDSTNMRLYIANGIKQLHGDITAAPGVAGIINNVCGRFKLAAGQSVFTLTNALAAVGDIVLVTRETADATLTGMIAVAGAGQIVFTGNAAATGAVTIAFQLMKVA